MTQRDVEARKRALLTEIQTDGAEAAYAAALAVCKDNKAPAPARATCATTILRAGGYLNAREDPIAPKQAGELTAADIEAKLAATRAALEALDAAAAAGVGSDDDAFG